MPVHDKCQRDYLQKYIKTDLKEVSTKKKYCYRNLH